MIPRISDIVGIVRKFAPFGYAEEWDNVGLQVGSPTGPVHRVMIALDPGREAVEAAVTAECQLLLTHHPLLFNPVKVINLSDPLGSVINLAVKKDLSIVSLHTNLDIAEGGVNDLLAERIGLGAAKVLKKTGSEQYVKLSVFVPEGHEDKILQALFRFSGFIGNYAECSFQTAGMGSFKALPGADPFIGEVGKREYVGERKIEVLLQKDSATAAVEAMVKVHPYEEPAFDLYPLLNTGKIRGLGRIGVVDPVPLGRFVLLVKERLNADRVRVVGDLKKEISKVAVCGGSGGSLIREAAWQGAHVLVTGDVKYHDARDAETLGMAVVDVGHFESESVMKQGLAEMLHKEMEAKGFEVEILICSAEKTPFMFV